MKRNQVRKVDRLERVVKFVFDNVGKTFSAKSISDYIKSEHRTINNETVYNYLEKLESAYLLTTDDFAGGNYQGIKTMHVADFLLSKEY